VPFVKNNAITGIDKSGRPIVDLAHKPALGKKVPFCPSLWGGKDWPSAAWSPKTRLVYVPANENLCGEFEGEKKPLVEGQLWLGTDPDKLLLTLQPGATHIGELQAWDPATGKKVWNQTYAKSPLFASVLATGGDLVFVGGTNDRYFRAYDAKSGKALWQQRTNSGIMGSPVAYEVDGVQYVAVQSGWGVDGQRIQDALAKLNIGIEADVPQGGMVWVFALKSTLPTVQ
jgi:alcohol dehydrogenase (cytochrome c)